MSAEPSIGRCGARGEHLTAIYQLCPPAPTASPRRLAWSRSSSCRVWIDVSRREFSGTPALPAGVYVNVGYQTTFANGKTARELVSFRLDEDKSWRVTGYVLN